MKPATNLVESFSAADSPESPAISRSLENKVSYQSTGKHLLASYSGCDSRSLNDVAGLLEAFREATRASGATILDESHHIFVPCGLTAMLLLSESHASIHTYPEHAACYVDLFTCGRDSDCQAFDQIMQAYLRPTRVQVKSILRHLSLDES